MSMSDQYGDTKLSRGEELEYAEGQHVVIFLPKEKYPFVPIYRNGKMFIASTSEPEDFETYGNTRKPKLT